MDHNRQANVANSLTKNFKRIQKDPLLFVETVWGLRRQPFKTKLHEIDAENMRPSDWTASMFEEVPREEFLREGYVSWQQMAIMEGIRRSIENPYHKEKNPEGYNRLITIRSGNGIGKTTTLSWLILWFLFSYKNCQIPCTANTGQQLHTVLWKEVKIWIDRMPDFLSSHYLWQNRFVKMRNEGETSTEWCALARSSSKEAPEVASGIHADHVLFIVDEASGVHDDIYEAAGGVLTGDFVLYMLISNPTRASGFFYRKHKKRSSWQKFGFSTLDSPVAKKAAIVQEKIEEYGEDSDHYRTYILGEFPSAEALDDQNYAPLFTESDLKLTQDDKFSPGVRMGIDPAGEGKDKTVWILRDRFKTKIILREKISTGIGIAAKTATLMDTYNISPDRIFVDGFGIGADTVLELAKVGYDVNSVILGSTHKPDNFKEYTSRKAENYFRLKTWVRNGGEFFGDKKMWEKLFTIKSKRVITSNRVKIKSKEEMRKDGDKSPDEIEAVMLTFDKPEEYEDMTTTPEYQYSLDAQRSRIDSLSG